MEQEREQALKLIRSFLNIQDGANYIPRSVISAIVSIADTPDDKMQSICLETLCEISLYNIELVAHCAGLKSVNFFFFFPFVCLFVFFFFPFVSLLIY